MQVDAGADVEVWRYHIIQQDVIRYRKIANKNSNDTYIQTKFQVLQAEEEDRKPKREMALPTMQNSLERQRREYGIEDVAIDKQHTQMQKNVQWKFKKLQQRALAQNTKQLEMDEL